MQPINTIEIFKILFNTSVLLSNASAEAKQRKKKTSAYVITMSYCSFGESLPELSLFLLYRFGSRCYLFRLLLIKMNVLEHANVHTLIFFSFSFSVYVFDFLY